MTVEEHTIVGGLGSAAAEALAEAGTGARLRRIGLRDTFAHEVGSQAHLLSVHGITEEQDPRPGARIGRGPREWRAARSRATRTRTGFGSRPDARVPRSRARSTWPPRRWPSKSALSSGAAIHVNGASGFLASNLLALLDRADELHGLGLRLHASARRPAGRVGLFGFLGLEPRVRWDLAPAESTTFPDELAGGVAVHTASYGAPADYLREPMATFQANTAGLIRTFAEAARVGAAHVVYLSSAEVYGQPPAEAIPTREDYDGGPDLGDIRSIYGESKRMAEVLGASLSRQTGIAFTAVRPWNLYGPGPAPRRRSRPAGADADGARGRARSHSKATELRGGARALPGMGWHSSPRVSIPRARRADP